ncbi:hypothetical protein [Lactococcus petauri]|uniref:hypothetical protein n=1 Tax=Lactococcus petauri TaxID=1940789 RepID=UPI0038529EE5
MTEHFGVYVTDHNNKTIELPVAPSEVMLTWENTNDSVEIVNLGEINRIGTRRLERVTLELFIPVDTKNAHYTTATKIKDKGGEYISFLHAWQQSKKAGRFLVSTTGIDRRMTVEKIDYGFKGGNADEYVISLSLIEWRGITLRKKNVPIPPPPKPKPAPPAKIGIGSTVIVNGQLHVDSYGGGPGQTERNAKRKINFIAQGRQCPYHVTDMSGGWRGWVTSSSVRLA